MIIIPVITNCTTVLYCKLTDVQVVKIFPVRYCLNFNRIIQGVPVNLDPPTAACHSSSSSEQSAGKSVGQNAAVACWEV
jgi:hypothetical protein